MLPSFFHQDTHSSKGKDTKTGASLLTGSCACLKVKYESTAIPHLWTNCHCECCRKLSGAPYMSFFQLPTSSVTFSSHESLIIRQFSPTAIRGLCSNCGSHIFMKYTFQVDKIGMVAGTIDDKNVKGNFPKTPVNIFVEEKATWHSLPDDEVIRFERHTNGFQEKIDQSEGFEGVVISRTGTSR